MAPYRRMAVWLLLALLVPALAGAQIAPSSSPKESAKAVAVAVLKTAQALAPPGAVVSVGPVAGAGYMQACTAPLAVRLSGAPPYEQAAVRCPNPSWTLYVTVTLAQSEAVVVAARPVAAGQALTSGDLMLRREPVQDFAGRQVYYDPAQLVGAQTVMSLSAGMVITQSAVQAPQVVKAGQTVTVRVISGGVQVSLDAQADQNGRVGDTILMTNRASGRRFTALVTPDGPVVRLQP